MNVSRVEVVRHVAVHDHDLGLRAPEVEGLPRARDVPDRLVGDSELVNAMIAHLLVCDECAKVAMMVVCAPNSSRILSPTSS